MTPEGASASVLPFSGADGKARFGSKILIHPAQRRLRCLRQLRKCRSDLGCHRMNASPVPRRRAGGVRWMRRHDGGCFGAGVPMPGPPRTRALVRPMSHMRQRRSCGMTAAPSTLQPLNSLAVRCCPGEGIGINRKQEHPLGLWAADLRRDPRIHRGRFVADPGRPEFSARACEWVPVVLGWNVG